MTKPVSVPNIFGTQSGTIPLNFLDQDFTAVSNSINDLATYSNYTLDGGTPNAFLISYASGIITTALTSGLRLQFKALNTNTGASTLQVQVNSVPIGTAPIKLTDGTALPANTIVAGAIVDVLFDGTNFQLMNDASGGGDIVSNLTVTGNLAVIGDSSFTGNVTANIANVTTLNPTNVGGNPTFTGNVTINGNGSNVKGNLTVGNITVLGDSSFTGGNITANVATITTFSGNPTFTGNVTINGNGSNIKGNLVVGNVTILGTASGNIAATAITNSGNLTFTGFGSRIFGDFSNATVTSRVAIQTSTANANTGIYILPNGTATAASIQVSNAADPTNASKILLATNGATDVQLVSGVNGTGTYLPMTFWNNNVERMRLDVSGNFAIGTASPGARLHLANSLSAAPFTTAGVGLRIDAATYTSTSTLSGTVAAHAIAQPSFAATTVSQTITNGATLYISAQPSAGTNVTITNPYSLYIANGNVYFGSVGLKIAGVNYTYPATEFGFVGTGLSVAGATYNSSAGIGTNVTANSFGVPAYSATTAAQVVTNAATLYIAGSPTAGTNVTITNSYGLWCQGDIFLQSNRFQLSSVASFTYPAANFGTIGYSFSQSSNGTITSAAGVSGTVAANSFSTGGSIGATTAGQTIANIVNLYVGTAPSAGTNVTITNSWSLYVTGNTYYGANINVGGLVARATTAGTGIINIFNGTAPVGTLTNGISLYSVSGDFNFMDATGGGYKVGFRNVPPVGAKTASYTIATTDVGKYVELGTSGAIVVPNSTFASGDVVSVFNNTASSATITLNTTNAYVGGVNTNRTTVTLATRGVATILFISATLCVVTGNVS